MQAYNPNTFAMQVHKKECAHTYNFTDSDLNSCWSREPEVNIRIWYFISELAKFNLWDGN